MIKCNIDTQQLTEKPKHFDGQLRNRLCNAQSIRTIEPEILIKAVRKGYTFTPAVMTGTTGDTWQSQQVICADIDNDSGRKDEDGNKIMLSNPLLPEQALKIMAKYNITPYFMYYSFSNTAEWAKYRIVLILDEPITDAGEANTLITNFTEIFNKEVERSADTTASDNARLYYGGKADSVFFESGTITPLTTLRDLPAATPKKAQRSAEVQFNPDNYKAPERSRTAAGGYRDLDTLQREFNRDKETFNLADYIEQTTDSERVINGRNTFFNPCPVCGHEDDFQVTGAEYHCHSASPEGGTGGTIIDYLFNAKNSPCKGDMKAALDYFKFNIMGYDRNEWAQATREAYRATNGDSQYNEYEERITYTEEEQVSPETDIFNIDALTADNDSKYIYLTLQEINAEEILALGRPAIALNSVKNLRILTNTITELQEQGKVLKPFIVAAFKDDEEALKWTESSLNGLYRLTYNFNGTDENGEQQDTLASIEAAEKTADTLATERLKAYEREYNAAARIDDFKNFIHTVRAKPQILTGYDLLDEALEGGLYSGLYIMGGDTGTGKTTFVLNLARNLSMAGNDILYFSLEMSEFELMAKLVSQESFLRVQERVYSSNDAAGAKTALGILCGNRYGNYSQRDKDIIEDAFKAYEVNSKNINIKAKIGRIKIEDIEQGVQDYILSHEGKVPIVIVDYLQILEKGDKKESDKETVDNSVITLKQLSNKFNTPVIAISSLNRSSYANNGIVTKGAFKDSGNIEFTADVLLALQFTRAGFEDFDEDTESKKKRQNITIKILKNRNGRKNIGVDFIHEAGFNHFEQIGEYEAPPPKKSGKSNKKSSGSGNANRATV